MNKLNMETAIKRYNKLLNELNYEHHTIGTRFSEGTEGWNLRDMVAECDYILSCYYEAGHCNNDMRYSEDMEERKMWMSETGKLKRFIEKYKPYINDLKCIAGHCSKYDNYNRL